MAKFHPGATSVPFHATCNHAVVSTNAAVNAFLLAYIFLFFVPLSKSSKLKRPKSIMLKMAAFRNTASVVW
jgi:hypothetical protein